jgi:hypothetical protein
MIIITQPREPTIKQSQLDDFLGHSTISKYNMKNKSEARAAETKFKKWFVVKHRKKKTTSQQRSYRGRQASLYDFLPKTVPHPLPKPAYTWRFRSISNVLYEDFAIEVISAREWCLLHTIPTFKGYFNHLFEFVDFSFFDDTQDELEENGASFKHISIHDVVAYELLRFQLGFRDYTGIEKMSYFIGNNPLVGVLHDKTFIPSASDTSYIMRRIPPEKLVEFRNILVKELIELKVLVPGILVWDCQFVHSNCNNNGNKQTKTYNDWHAGYGRHNGKKLGVGYKISRLYAYCGSWDRAFEVYCEVFPANRSDNPVFRETVVHFMRLKIGTWKIILGDSGAYSVASLELCRWFGLHPIIRAKKGLVNQPVEEVKKGYWFNKAYYPPGWTKDDVMSMYTKRPVIEAGQSWNDTIYNASRMNTRGRANAIRQQTMLNILALVRPITAHKLGRNDLAPVITAFSMAREYVMSNAWPSIAQQAGYDIMLKPPRYNLARKKGRK